jgi:hypothetical protein
MSNARRLSWRQMNACKRAADRTAGSFDRGDIECDRFGALFDRVALMLVKRSKCCRREGQDTTIFSLKLQRIAGEF